MLCCTIHCQWGRKSPLLGNSLGLRHPAGGWPGHGHSQHAQTLDNDRAYGSGVTLEDRQTHRDTLTQTFWSQYFATAPAINTSLHHYECVAPGLANIRQKGRFWAASLASVSFMWNDERSSAMLRIQVERGRSGGLLQFSGGCSRGRNNNNNNNRRRTVWCVSGSCASLVGLQRLQTAASSLPLATELQSLCLRTKCVCNWTLFTGSLITNGQTAAKTAVIFNDVQLYT